MTAIPVKTIERLSKYRRVINRLLEKGETYIFSHDLAHLIDSTPAQVRRDLMQIGHTGSPKKGYELKQLKENINALMDDSDGQGIGLAGIGYLGRAIMNYFGGRNPKLTIKAAFDTDHDKINRVIYGCRCYHIDQIPEVVKKENITIGIVTVPSSAAQDIVNRFVRTGIKAIINWAPTPLQTPPDVFVESRDITMSIEKAAFYAKTLNSKKK